MFALGMEGKMESVIVFKVWALATRFLKMLINFCYQQSYYLAEITISTGVALELGSG